MTYRSLVDGRLEYSCDQVGCGIVLVVEPQTDSAQHHGWSSKLPKLGVDWTHFCPDHQSVLHDPVNHPSHYTTHQSGVEAIDICEHHDFLIGNVIKYLWRAGRKDNSTELEDLLKARWYLNRKIANLEKHQ